MSGPNGPYYVIPDDPEYNPNIPSLDNDDPASASETFNPWILPVIINNHAVKLKADKAMSIAEGAGRAWVFDDTAQLDAWLAVPANVALLQVGDNLYIRNADEPDFWWDGGQRLPLSTEKVVLEEATQERAGIVQLENSVTSTSNTKAATPNSVKTAYDTAVAANANANERAPSNASLTAETGMGVDVTTPAVASNTIATLLQTIWGKIRQVGNVITNHTNSTTAHTAANVGAAPSSHVSARGTAQHGLAGGTDVTAGFSQANFTNDEKAKLDGIPEGGGGGIGDILYTYRVPASPPWLRANGDVVDGYPGLSALPNLTQVTPNTRWITALSGSNNTNRDSNAHGNGWWAVSNGPDLFCKQGSPIGDWTIVTGQFSGQSGAGVICYLNGYWINWSGATIRFKLGGSPQGTYTSVNTGFNIGDLTYGNGYWVATVLGTTTSNQIRVCTTTGAPTTTWTSVTVPLGGTDGIEFGNNFFATTQPSGTSVAYVSGNPTGAWTAQAMPTPARTGGKIRFLNNMWIVAHSPPSSQADAMLCWRSANPAGTFNLLTWFTADNTTMGAYGNITFVNNWWIIQGAFIPTYVRNASNLGPFTVGTAQFHTNGTTAFATDNNRAIIATNNQARALATFTSGTELPNIPVTAGNPTAYIKAQ